MVENYNFDFDDPEHEGFFVSGLHRWQDSDGGNVDVYYYDREMSPYVFFASKNDGKKRLLVLDLEKFIDVGSEGYSVDEAIVLRYRGDAFGTDIVLDGLDQEKFAVEPHSLIAKIDHALDRENVETGDWKMRAFKPESRSHNENDKIHDYFSTVALSENGMILMYKYVCVDTSEDVDHDRQTSYEYGQRIRSKAKNGC